MKTVAWLLGRGVPASCGLSWEVPSGLYAAVERGELTHEELAKRVRSALARFQHEQVAKGCIDVAPFERLVQGLKEGSRPGWTHAFVTTNWDTILDAVLASYAERMWHLNGSIEDRSCAFLTELDTRSRAEGAGAQSAGFRTLVRSRVCVLVGLSLSSALDRDLVVRLAAARAGSPAAQAWYIVNPDPADLRRCRSLLRPRLPRGAVVYIRSPFERWVSGGMPELAEIGVLAGRVIAADVSRTLSRINL